MDKYPIKMKKKQKEKRYPNYGEYINNTMDAVFAFVAKNSGGKVADKDYLILDKLADMLFLYEQVKKHLEVNGITQVGARGNTQKSEFIKTATELLVQIMKISEKFGLNVRDERKIKEVDTSDNFAELMESLNEN